MRTDGTRKYVATRLRGRIVEGPSLDSYPFTSLTDKQVAEVREKYLIWVHTWILDDLDRLVPELRDQSKKDSQT